MIQMTNRKKIVLALVIALISLLLGNFLDSMLPLNNDYVTTIDENTQGSLRNITIGVGNIWDKSATLFLANEKDETSEIEKRIKKGDQFAFHQFDFEVLDIRQGFWPLGVGKRSVTLTVREGP